MNQELFIMTAYGATGLLLLLLCAATWRAAMRTRRQLRERSGP